MLVTIRGKYLATGTEERGAAALFPAMNQELNIRVYAHTVVGKADCKVSFTVVSEGGNRFAQKHCAYVAADHRGKIHRHARARNLMPFDTSLKC
jgi:hypothetical protein